MTIAPFLVLALGAAQVHGTVWSEPAKPRLGDLAIIYARNIDPTVRKAGLRVFGYEFVAFRVSEDVLRAVIAVPMDVDPGDFPVQVVLPTRAEQWTLEVAARDFDTSELQVSKEFTQKKTKALLERLKEEERQWRAIFDAEPGPPRFNGKLSRPVSGEVTAVFGTRRIFNGKLSSTHYGLDLEAKIGDPIHAAAAGKVVMSAMRWASGGTVIVDHGGGLFTAYFHMSKRNKNPGDIVKAGDLLGLAGKTGRVTGPHLHLAVLVRAVKLDRGRPRGARSFYVEPDAFLQRDFAGDAQFLGIAGARTTTAAIAGQR